MSEMNFPFQGGADEQPESGSRTKVLVAGTAGVVALVLLAVFVVMPMLSGGGDEEVPIAKGKAPATGTKAKAPAKPKAAAPKPQALPKTFDENFQRDPFKPLYTPPKVAAGGAAAPAPGTAPGAAPAPAYPAPAAQGSSSQVGGSRVALVDVFVRAGKTFAQTKVNSAVYTPGVGQVFATNYQLLTASGSCATYLYGDEQFQLCEGQEVLK